MSFRHIVSSVALACVSMVSLCSVAQAQSRDRCHDYANELVSLNQRAQQLRCASWAANHTGRGTTYNQHYAWCERNSPSTTQTVINQWGSDFQRCQFEASGSPAAQPPRPTGATLRSGAYIMNSSNHNATVTLTVQGATFTGQSAWQCCPSPRIDPIVNGRIAGGRVSFVRDCSGQGQRGACRQTYTGVISGTTVSGTWTGTGAPPGGTGRWTMRLR